MRRMAFLSFVVCAVALSLAGCGVSSANGAQAPQPGASPTTDTGGVVSITTDQTQYQPDATIHVTVTNHLSTPIAAYDTRSGCSILDLQRLVSGQWQTVAEARCAMGRPARQVVIQPGATYSAAIYGGLSQKSPVLLPGGSYRLMLAYQSTEAGMGAGVLVYSAQLTVLGGSSPASQGAN